MAQLRKAVGLGFRVRDMNNKSNKNSDRSDTIVADMRDQQQLLRSHHDERRSLRHSIIFMTALQRSLTATLALTTPTRTALGNRSFPFQFSDASFICLDVLALYSRTHCIGESPETGRNWCDETREG